MKITTYYPGSFGEIIQGKYEKKDILCSFPVELFTKVTIFETQKPVQKLKYNKCNILLNNILKEWDYEKYIDNIDISILSDIPVGKGFASSTADLCALYSGLIKIFHKKYCEEELIRNCTKIEPTDSIIFNNFTLFDYKTGSYKESLGQYLKFNILVFEGSRIVDTVQFNNTVIENLEDIDDLVYKIKKAVPLKDIKNIACCSTKSIIRNNSRLTYQVLPYVLKIMKEIGGFGIIGAHSGNALGIIYKEKFDIKILDNYRYLLNEYKIYKLKTLEKINEF